MLTYNKELWDKASQLVRRDPGKLTDQDIEQLSILDERYGQEARAARVKALNPPPVVTPPVDSSSIKGPLTRREDALVEGMFKAVKLALGVRDERIASAVTRIAALEAHAGITPETPVQPAAGKPKVKFAGEWSDGGAYALDDAVTDNGRLFRCKAYHVRSRPTGDPVCWEPIGGTKRDAA